MNTKCVCPSNLDPLIMIEYPGFVKNHQKALDTMGGIEAIEKVTESQKDRLELKFRKSDPLAHPAFGDRVPKKCLVLRVKKVRKETANSNDGTESSFQMSVVGQIQTSFRFETMAEFQWLPMQRINTRGDQINPSEIQAGITIKRTPESLNPKYISILDDVLPLNNPFDNTLKNFNPDAPLLLLPAVFSRFDTPREIHQPHPKFRSEEMRAEYERQQSMAIIGRTRKKRTTMSYLINFDDAIPKKASEKLDKHKTEMTTLQEGLIPKLQRSFEKQPVWSKSSLCFELNCQSIDLKYILPLVAFHYQNGPFRTMWVRYGYDPHKDKSSKIFQTLDFRNKNFQESNEYSRRSINQHQLPMRKVAEKTHSKQLDLKSMISGTRVAKKDPQAEFFEDHSPDTKDLATTEALCKFRRDLIPVARQLSYQLKDIEIDEVQAIVHSNDGKEPEVCSRIDGWLPEGSIERIRKVMTKCLRDNLEDQLQET